MIDNRDNNAAWQAVSEGDALWAQLRQRLPLELASAVVADMVMEASRETAQSNAYLHDLFAELIRDSLAAGQKC